LEIEHPILFQHFMMGQFVVQDREGGKFNAVSPDMKLEQTINRSEKGPGGHVIVGSSGSESIVVEFELLFHEIARITNLLNNLTNAGLMEHLDTTVLHHELHGQKSSTISKVKLPCFDTQASAEQYSKPKKTTISAKRFVATLHTIEIAKQRNYTIEQVLSHDKPTI
jgi:hypothetical protein